MAEYINYPEINQLFKEVGDYITTAGAKVGEGRYVELSDLNGSVEILCDKIRALPKPIGQEYADTLDTLCDQLVLLQQAMQRAKDKLVEESNSQKRRNLAQKTYASASAPAPNPKRAQ